jgi:hypothetical protein
MTRWLVAGVAMAIIAVIAVALLQVDRAAKPNASPGVRVASTSAASPMAANAPVVDTSALPPPNAPLAQVFDSLRAAAAHGNAAAACRLAMEIQRCGALAYQVEGLQQIKRVPISELLLKGKFAESFARAVAEMRTKVDNDTPVCEGMPAPEVAPWRLLLDAGLQGHVPSMARFASGSTLREAKGRGEWDLDAYGAYRAYALIFLRRAAEEGDAASIERLGVEHLTPGFGTRAIPYDPVRGLAYLKALSARASSSYRKQLDETADGLAAKARMSSADVAAAATLAATVLPQGALTRLAGIAKPAHGPDDDFGCR